ncbi:hypothetical protein BH11ARM2_BH11ARM2_17710 [soil metagenome]
MRAALIPVFLLTAALAAGDVTLDFGSPGERLVFAAAKPPEFEPEGGTLTKEDTVTFSGASEGQTIYVWDRKAGKIASRPTKGSVIWTLKDADYKDVAGFTVAIDPARPVRVTLKDARRSVARLADNGKAAFFFVKPGRAEATVEFNQDGKPKTITQIVDVTPNGTATIALPGGTATPTETTTSQTTDPEAPNADSKTQNAEPKTQSPSGSAGNVFAYLIGLAVVGGIGYTALRYYQGNKGQVDSQLEKLGVQVPKPQDAALSTADPLPAMPKKPDPPAKIVLDDAAPTPLASVPVPMAQVAMPKAGGGVWLAQGADRVDIPNGETVVGREPGLGLSLVGESSVSRHHATLMRMGDTVTLTDNGSTNGTFVNGAKVTSPTVLRQSDEVRFGQATFRFGG